MNQITIGRLVAIPLLLGLVLTSQACAQANTAGTNAPSLKFAVASIHPLSFPAPGSGPHIVHVMFTSDGLSDEGVPLGMVLPAAFGVSGDRILGLPDWVKRTDYSIEAKVDSGDAQQFENLTKRQKWAMVLSLFEDRFSLRFHSEAKEMSAYGLVIAKGGPKLKKSDDEELGNGGGPKPLKVSRSEEGFHLEANGVSMATVADFISEIVGSPVIDKTGLTARYDLTLDYSDETTGLAAKAQSPSIFTALQEQLGLKLESGKGPVNVVVIDHIEQPSPN